MVKIPLAELSSFLSKSKDIKDNNLMPILKYVKLDCTGDVCTITKTNLQAFIVCELVGAKFQKNFTLLLEEKILTAAVSQSTAKEMKISFKEVKSETATTRTVSLEDGDMIDVKFQSQDENTFPQIPVGDRASSTPFDTAIIESIFLSSKCCNPPKEIKVWNNYVHIKNTEKKKSYICGMNGQIIYFKSFGKQLPSISLELDSCSVIKQYQELSYYTGGNYNFFDAGKTLFGFIRSEVTAPDFMKIVEMMDTSKQFSISRKDVIRFCKLAISLNPMSYVGACYVKGQDDNKVILDYENVETAIQSKVILEVKKNKKYSIPKFLFNPKEMLTMLENLPFEKINFAGPVTGNYYILSEEDKDYMGAIREIIFVNELKTTTDANK